MISIACVALTACGGGGSVAPQSNAANLPPIPSTPTAPTPTAPTPTASPAPAAPAAPTQTASAAHITLVVMENYPYEQVIGSAAAPYINSLINSSALMTNSHAVSHPSEPNYLALFSGSTQGMSSDACPVSFSGANLATELAAHGDSFAGYAENLPADISACFADKSTSVSSGYMYWRKHVPWVDFTNVPAADSHAYTSGSALAGTVNFVVPNICHDMHDCGVGAGDAWLAQNVPGIQSYDSANKGLLIVTFDEGENGSNHIVTLFNGPMVHTGKYSQPIDHYSVLRLIESTFGLQLLGKSATASSIKGVLNNP